MYHDFYDWDMNNLSLLQQMEVYFNINDVTGKKRITFYQLKLERHALAWWESDVTCRALENEPPVTDW